MFEKKVLIEQIDDRIRRGIAVFLHIYSHILSDSAEDEEKSAAVEILDSINFLTKAIISIQENGLTEEHKDLIYKLAKGEENG